MKAFAALLLLLGVVRHYAWEAVPPAAMVHVWNASTAAVILTMVWMLAYRWPATVLIAIWWSFEELQVVACSTWLMLRPAPIVEGQGQCSSLLGFDLSSVGILLVALVLLAIPVRSYRSRKKENLP